MNVIPKLGTHLFSPPALCVTYSSCNSTPPFGSTCNRAFCYFTSFICRLCLLHLPTGARRGALGGSHLSAGRLSETVVSWVSHHQNLLSNPLCSLLSIQRASLTQILSSLPGSCVSWWNTQWVSSSASRPPESCPATLAASDSFNLCFLCWKRCRKCPINHFALLRELQEIIKTNTPASSSAWLTAALKITTLHQYAASQ